MTPVTAEDRVRMAAELRYSEHLGREETGHLASPQEVSSVAAKLAAHFFKGDTAGGVAVAVHKATMAGLMVYAMERWGYNYGEVVTIADFDVARTVAAISHDIRQPIGPRVAVHCSTLSQADALPQLVKLAEIIACCRRVEAQIEAREVSEDSQVIKQWAEDAVKLVGALSKVRDHVRTKKAVGQVRARLVAIADGVSDGGRRRRPYKPEPDLEPEIDIEALEVC